MSDFSTNLKKLRRKATLSQDQLAERLNVTRQTVSSWERGKSYPDLDMLVQICDALHTTPDRLLYPPEKRGRPGAEEIVDAALFQKTGIAVFVIGFALGISAGSGSYSPVPNTVGWHFVFSYALRYWGGAFLIGMIFVGIGKILSLLSAIRETE